MKLIVTIHKPYTQMTLEKGKNIKDCIRKALVKFDKEFISGCGDMEAMIKNNAELQGERDANQRVCFYKDYSWKVSVYDPKTDTIFDATWAMDEIIDDIHAELQRRWKSQDDIKKELLYRERLKDEI